MGNASSDNGGGNDSSSSNDNGISSSAIDKCINTITFDNGSSINCRTGEISSYSLNDAIGHTPSNSSLNRNDEDRSTYSSESSYDRQFVKDCYSSYQKSYDKILNVIDLGKGNSYNMITGKFSFYSLNDVIGNTSVIVDNVKNLNIISPDKKHLMNCKKITFDEYTKLREKLMNDGFGIIGFNKFHELLYLVEFLYQYELTEMTNVDYEDYIYLINLLNSDNKTSTNSVAKTITQIPIVKQTIIQTPVVKISPSVVKTPTQTQVVKTSTLSIPKTKESIDKYVKISNDLYSQYNAGKMTTSEFLKVNNNVKEVYEKYGHLTSVQFSNQVYLKISEDASKQYKADKMTASEFVKVHNDARTKYYTEPVKPPAPTPIQTNSILNNIGSGYVASAQARVNAVNLATSVVNNTAQAIVNGVVSVRNELISINNDTVLRQMETDRLQNESTRQIVSNVSSAIANNAPQVIQETAEGVSSFGFEVSTQVVTGYNPVGLAISGANEALSSINNREKGIVESTCEAVATIGAVIISGEAALAIGGGLLAKTAGETYYNAVNTHIQNTLEKITDENKKEQKAQIILDGINTANEIMCK
jgi:hypothetical protein